MKNAQTGINHELIPNRGNMSVSSDRKMEAVDK